MINIFIIYNINKLIKELSVYYGERVLFPLRALLYQAGLIRLGYPNLLLGCGTCSTLFQISIRGSLHVDCVKLMFEQVGLPKTYYCFRLKLTVRAFECADHCSLSQHSLLSSYLHFKIVLNIIFLNILDPLS